MAYIYEECKWTGTLDYGTMEDSKDIDEEYFEAEGEVYMDF